MNEHIRKSVFTAMTHMTDHIEDVAELSQFRVMAMLPVDDCVDGFVCTAEPTTKAFYVEVYVGGGSMKGMALAYANGLKTVEDFAHWTLAVSKLYNRYEDYLRADRENIDFQLQFKPKE